MTYDEKIYNKIHSSTRLPRKFKKFTRSRRYRTGVHQRWMKRVYKSITDAAPDQLRKQYEKYRDYALGKQDIEAYKSKIGLINVLMTSIECINFTDRKHQK